MCIRDSTNTAPIVPIGPHSQWGEPGKIVSLDPFGHMIGQVFAEELKDGIDIRPTIAVTKARLELIEMQDAIRQGRLKPDGKVLLDTGEVNVTKMAVEQSGTYLGLLKDLGLQNLNSDETSLNKQGECTLNS